jgi:hypothetical protein
MLAGAIVLAALVVWTLTTLTDRDNKVSAGISDVLHGGASADSTATDAAIQLRSCRDDVALAEEAVAKARTAVTGWATHVQARTDMLAHRISVKKMNAIWDRTRLAGPDNIAEFEAAARRYPGADDCRRLSGAKATAAQRAAADACVRRGQAADQALSQGRAAVQDWQAHLHHMARFSDGGMSAGKAQKLWVAAWREAPTNIKAFKAAEETLSQTPECASAGS